MAISAMIDEDYELKFGEEVIKPKGELLSLTAPEAIEGLRGPADATTCRRNRSFARFPNGHPTRERQLRAISWKSHGRNESLSI